MCEFIVEKKWVLSKTISTDCVWTAVSLSGLSENSSIVVSYPSPTEIRGLARVCWFFCYFMTKTTIRFFLLVPPTRQTSEFNLESPVFQVGCTHSPTPSSMCWVINWSICWTLSLAWGTEMDLIGWSIPWAWWCTSSIESTRRLEFALNRRCQLNLLCYFPIYSFPRLETHRTDALWLLAGNRTHALLWWKRVLSMSHWSINWICVQNRTFVGVLAKAPCLHRCTRSVKIYIYTFPSIALIMHLESLK